MVSALDRQLIREVNAVFSEYARKNDATDINGSSKPRSQSRHDKFPALIDQTEIDEGCHPITLSKLRKWISSVTGR